MSNGYVLMEILVSEVLAIFAKKDGFLLRKFKCTFGCRIKKCIFKILGKVVMSHNLLVLEVMNEK